MGFKHVTLELAAIRGRKVHDNDVGMDCSVVRVLITGNRIRYLLRYSDGVILPVRWNNHLQGMTERAQVLRQSRCQ